MSLKWVLSILPHIKKKQFLDIFIISNFFFLCLDIVYAHSINRFAHWGEWLPIGLCILAFFLLSISLLFFSKSSKNFISPFIGMLSILIGIWGVVFHLESQFFQDTSLKSLVYTAPFIAPLSFVGLGFLLFVNRSLESTSKEWSSWVIFLAYLGFLGNFILSLCDHAQNGFFYLTEWIPVISSALVLGFIPYYISPKRNDFMKKICRSIVLLQILVGLVGFILHFYGVFGVNRADVDLWEKILYGAPLMAPLLFTNLGFLLFIGMISFDSTGKRVFV